VKRCELCLAHDASRRKTAYRSYDEPALFPTREFRHHVLVNPIRLSMEMGDFRVTLRFTSYSIWIQIFAIAGWTVPGAFIGIAPGTHLKSERLLPFLRPYSRR
jgi:hypothetical protein